MTMQILSADGRPIDAPKGNDRNSGYARNKNDWYVEPPWTVADLLDAEKFSGGIWDPSCGRGTVPIVAGKRGYASYGSDLVDRGFGLTNTDFFEVHRGMAANIVCNPPFNVIERWIQHALQLTTGKVAIFGTLRMLEGVGRAKLFRATPLARVWVCSDRVPCPPGEQAPAIEAWERGTISGTFVPYAWFVWQHGHVGDWTGGFLPLPRDRVQGELLTP